MSKVRDLHIALGHLQERIGEVAQLAAEAFKDRDTAIKLLRQMQDCEEWCLCEDCCKQVQTFLQRERSNGES